MGEEEDGPEVTISSTEMLIYELLATAGTDEFKRLFCCLNKFNIYVIREQICGV